MSHFHPPMFKLDQQPTDNNFVQGNPRDWFSLHLVLLPTSYLHLWASKGSREGSYQESWGLLYKIKKKHQGRGVNVPGRGAHLFWGKNLVCFLHEDVETSCIHESRIWVRWGKYELWNQHWNLWTQTLATVCFKKYPQYAWDWNTYRHLT